MREHTERSDEGPPDVQNRCKLVVANMIKHKSRERAVKDGRCRGRERGPAGPRACEHGARARDVQVGVDEIPASTRAALAAGSVVRAIVGARGAGAAANAKLPVMYLAFGHAPHQCRVSIPMLVIGVNG
jgi:hypothetical protein